jgi:hypothetical protein
MALVLMIACASARRLRRRETAIRLALRGGR